MKDKIIEILMTDLQGCDRETIYCNTCIGGDRCDGCIRKQMNWGISREYAEEIADEILRVIDFK